ncbi:toxin-antitoxin system YwqK family antitoxin [Streptomyces sp. NPDC006527]|uniref:toxin-antitoxin system YwqK family antitoxin n=1 Tax=Streptomyces sp. NPDC006527 TaxID=3364749 RepID=UPI0036B34A2D
MTEVKRINIDDPEVDMDMGQRLLYRGEPFTGEVEEYLGDARVSLETYADGLPDGPSWEWYKDGTLRAEVTVRKGRAVGIARRWHQNGVLASERSFSEDNGTFLASREWDEQGQPTEVWRKDED